MSRVLTFSYRFFMDLFQVLHGVPRIWCFECKPGKYPTNTFDRQVAAADLGLTGTQGDMIIGVIGGIFPNNREMDRQTD